MKKLLCTSFALGLLAALSACTTVVQKPAPTTTSTTTQETSSVRTAPVGVTTTTY